MTVNEILKNKHQVDKKKVRKLKERIENDKGINSFMSIGSTIYS